MPALPTAAFRAVGPADAIPDGFVVPFYLSDRKLRISVARAGGRLYAFDDLCTCAGTSCPLSGSFVGSHCRSPTARVSRRRPSLHGVFGSMLIEGSSIDVATLDDRQDAQRTGTGRTRS
jgi:hypothetical protein